MKTFQEERLRKAFSASEWLLKDLGLQEVGREVDVWPASWEVVR